MRKRLATVIVIAIALIVSIALGQEIRDMADFVAKGNAGELTDEEIAAFTANWTEEVWRAFYIALAQAAGYPDPEAVAAELIAEDRELAGLDPIERELSAINPPNPGNPAPASDALESAATRCEGFADVGGKNINCAAATTPLQLNVYGSNGYIGVIVRGRSGESIKDFSSVASR